MRRPSVFKPHRLCWLGACIGLSIAGWGRAQAAWLQTDIGTVSAAGEFSIEGGTLAVSGSGADIAGTSDECFYLYRPMAGDGGMTLRILDFDGTMAWAKAGIMIRESLASSSRHAAVVKAPNTIGNGIALQYRAAPGGDTKLQGIRNLHVTPHWLRLERVGSQFFGWHAFDEAGAPGEWVTIGPAVTVPMGQTAWIGICLTSQLDGTLATAHFDRLSFTGGATQPLIGHWPLDGNAAAWEGPFGEVVGATPADGVDGVDEHALQFALAEAGVSIPRAPEMHAPDFSVCLWYRPDTPGWTGDILTLEIPGAEVDRPWVYQLACAEDGRLSFAMRHGGDSAMEKSASTGPGVIEQGRWTHIGVTYESVRSRLRIWIDGEDSTAAESGSDAFGVLEYGEWEGGLLRLGGALAGPGSGPIATLDDLRIYTLALSEIELKEVLLEAEPLAPPSWPPFGEFLSPGPGQWYEPDIPIQLTAEAFEPDGGTVSEVRFFADGALVGMATGPNAEGLWSVAWVPTGQSPIQLQLEVVGDDGRTFRSEPIEMIPAPELQPDSIVIHEIHYDPDLANEWVEFVELYNRSQERMDLGHWRLTGALEYRFEPGSWIEPGGYLVVAQDVQQVRTKYGVSDALTVGPFSGRMANENEELELLDPIGRFVDLVDYQLGYPWPTVGDPVTETQPGTGFSIQLMDPGLDNGLGGAWRSAAPTPGRSNTQIANSNPPPFTRQVEHRPGAPMSGEAVTITVKVTDDDAVNQVLVQYQVVAAGDYIELSDARYQTAWTDLPMNDAGQDGDLKAGDDVYTAVIDSTVQEHRTLVRYRILARDTTGHAVTVPYADDPQPNFAYFCYDGVPDWTGAVRPGATTPVEFPATSLTTVPVYHLITKKSETENCTWFDQDPSSVYRYSGALVYDGVVYDHIQFRARGGAWRFAMRKNMWKMHFNRGHFFQGYDNYGEPYETKWNRLNLGACIQQGDYLHRGEQGMFESVGFALFNLAGIPAPNTNFVHFRIIDEAGEQGPVNAAHPPLTESGTQYDGDFWGLYLATEQMDGRFLDEHGLPDGNLYKMEGGTGELKNLSPNGVTDRSDLNTFQAGYSAYPAEDWWRENVNLDGYYRYRSILECIHHYDIGAGKNYYYFLDPAENRWTQLPWDIDLTWADNMYGDGNEPFRNFGVLNHAGIQVEYRNRLREVRDLLFNPDQTGQLIDEFASKINPAGGPSLVDADRAQWDYHWVMTREAYWYGYSNNDGKAGQGRFYEISPTGDFEGMLQRMKEYVVQRGAWVDGNLLQDSAIPRTPSISYVGPEGHPLDSLSFSISPFSDPQGAGTFQAVKWRIAEVEPFAAASPTGQEESVMLLPRGSVFRYFPGVREPSTPVAAWRQKTFDDSSWAEGATTIGWGESGGFLATPLQGMADTHLSFYLRRQFQVEDPALLEELEVRALFDDGFNLWINGNLAVSQNMFGENVAFDQRAADYNQNEMNWFSFKVPADLLQPGENWVCVQVQNRSRNSSDCFFNVELAAKPVDAQAGVFGRPGKYEIDPVWESGEQTEWSDRVLIPGRGLRPGHTYRVRAKVLDQSGRWSHWSSPVQFEAAPGLGTPMQSSLRITELMYNPASAYLVGGYTREDFEFVELFNRGEEPIDLGSVAFIHGIQYVFPEGTILQPGQYLVVAGNPTAFALRYPDVHAMGPFNGNLANSGEPISLEHVQYGVIESFTYSDARGWPLASDGGGHSIVPIAETYARSDRTCLDYGLHWRFSHDPLGSPGRADPEPVPGVRISEFAADSNLGSGSNDWIELINIGPTSVSLSGFFLSDERQDLDKFALPSQMLAAGGRVVFDERTGFGFGLSRTGEELVLSFREEGNLFRVVDEVRFEGQLPLRTEGRYPDGGAWFVAMKPTPGGGNSGPIASVVLDEIMYRPVEVEGVPQTSEFVELWNWTSKPVVLSGAQGGWRVGGGIEFVFPIGVSIPAGGRLVLVPFHPEDLVARDRFMAEYGLDEGEGIRLFGPYSGALSNGGERVALESPIASEDPSAPIAWVIQDEVIYFDALPWPETADGMGASLQRKSAAWSGNDPENWRAGEPSPGDWLGGLEPASATSLQLY